MNHGTTTNGRNFASLLAETKEEIGDFFWTRIVMLKTELQEKFRNLKLAAAAVAAALMVVSSITVARSFDR